MNELSVLLKMLERLRVKLSVVEPQGSQEMSLLIQEHELEKRISDMIYYQKVLCEIN